MPARRASPAPLKMLPEHLSIHCKECSLYMLVNNRRRIKNKKNKMISITLGMIAIVLVLAVGINSVLTGKTNTTRTEKIREEMNYTIPLSGTVALDMVWIESGTFKMGSPKNELGRYEDEVRHKVTLT